MSVGGSWLGAPKVYAALMSGEMKDTAALGTGSMFIDNYVPQTLRVKVCLLVFLFIYLFIIFFLFFFFCFVCVWCVVCVFV